MPHVKTIVPAFLLLFTLALHGWSQTNLVPNPSFEDTVACPSNDNQVYNAQGWVGAVGTPDYYNSCAPAGFVSVPNNWGGYQPAASGNAYCGFGTYGDWVAGTREFIQTTLTTPLTIGTKYYLSFKLSLSVSSGMYFNCATNKTGALLSTYPYYYDFTSDPLPDIAQVYTDSIITDTVGWVQVNGSFIADSSYQYITLGNFFSDALTDTLVIIPDTNYITAYYFIDDICLSTDSSYCANYTYTGIAETSQLNNILVYPNPASNQITIDFGNTPGNVSAMLFNSQGQLIKETLPGSTSVTTLNVQDLANGIYLLQVAIDNSIYQQKIIVNH